MRLFRVAFIASTILLVASTLAAHADTTYIYTGREFTTFVPPFMGSESLTGSLTLDSPLGDNFNGVVTPLSFSFSDGYQSTDSGVNFSNFKLDTNASGVITSWVVQFYFIGGGMLQSNNAVGDLALRADDTFAFVVAAGAWTETTPAVPEPESLMLVGTGLLGVLGVARRKFLAQP